MKFQVSCMLEPCIDSWEKVLFSGIFLGGTGKMERTIPEACNL